MMCVLRANGWTVQDARILRKHNVSWRCVSLESSAQEEQFFVRRHVCRGTLKAVTNRSQQCLKALCGLYGSL